MWYISHRFNSIIPWEYLYDLDLFNIQINIDQYGCEWSPDSCECSAASGSELAVFHLATCVTLLPHAATLTLHSTGIHSATTDRTRCQPHHHHHPHHHQLHCHLLQQLLGHLPNTPKVSVLLHILKLCWMFQQHLEQILSSSYCQWSHIYFNQCGFGMHYKRC